MAANLVFLAVFGLTLFALYAIFWIPYRARRDSIRAARERADERERRQALERIWAEEAQAAAARDKALMKELEQPAKPRPSPYGLQREPFGMSYVVSPEDEAAIDRALRKRAQAPVRTTYVPQADPRPYLETVVETIVEEVEEVVIEEPVYVAPAYVAPVYVAPALCLAVDVSDTFSSAAYDSGGSDFGTSTFD